MRKCKATFWVEKSSSASHMNRRVVGLKSTGCSPGLSDPPFYEAPGFLNLNINAIISIGLVRLSPRQWLTVVCGAAN